MGQGKGKDGLRPAAPDIPCADSWRLALVRESALLAYKTLHRQGKITLRYPIRMYRARVEIRYLSPCPHEWTRELLRRTEEELIADRRASQQRMAI
jgi:hypothetical protein